MEPYKHITKGDKQMVFMIMGNMHVGKSYWHVAKYWLKRTRKKGVPKFLRFELAREGLACHKQNRDLYESVMLGKYYVDPE